MSPAIYKDDRWCLAYTSAKDNVRYRLTLAATSQRRALEEASKILGIDEQYVRVVHDEHQEILD
jgi:L-fucose isomerase-like protein